METHDYPSDLTDAQWALIESHIPAAPQGGRPRKTPMRDVVDAILYILRTGCQWRYLPSDFPPKSTVWRYFDDWRRDDTLDTIHDLLRKKVRAAEKQVLTWTDKLGHTASYSYSVLGQLLTVVDRNGITAVTNTYDTTGRLVSTADALGNTTNFAWDGRGRRIQVTDPAGNTTSSSYDLLDRVTGITFPDRTTIQNAYNCCQLAQVIDQLNHVTTYVYDDLGRLTQATDPTGAVTNLAFDAAGNLVSLTDPDSHTWQWQYDALNRRSTQLDPLHDQETWTYDGMGNTVRRVDGNGVATTYTYDALDRLTQTAYPDGTTVAMTYDAVGNRLTAANALGQWSWAYDANGLVTSAQPPFASGATHYQYDNEGNRTRVTDPDGNATTTAYDQAYRAASIGFPVNSQAQTVTYRRDPRGLVTQRILPNGVASTYDYDALGRMTSIQHGQSGGTVLFGFNYQYDGAGNLTQETSQRWDTGLGATMSYQANYAYDARYQLTTEKYYQGGNFALELDYTYDPAGNRIKQVTTNPTTADSPVTVSRTYSADNQVAQAVRTSPLDPTQTTNYAEDGNGSLTQASGPSGTITYSYDFERRLTRVGLANGTTVQFAYDPDGLRARKIGVSGAVINYVLDELQVLLERDSLGATQVRYVPGLARIAGGAVSYYLEDRLGSVVGLSDPNQNVTDALRYDAWGNLLQQQGPTNPAYQWVGEGGYYTNPDAGLYLVGLRHYAPGMGRFVTRDPWGIGGGDSNQYRYVKNRTLQLIDPYGSHTNADCVKWHRQDVKECERLQKSREAHGMPGWLNEIMFDACILQAIASLMDCQATSEEALACVRKAALVVGSVIVIGGVCYLVVQSGGTILLVPAVAL